MLAPYKPRKVFDAQLTLQVWLRLVADEQLYDAMLAGRHGEAARARGMSDEEILVLDDLGSQPGTRWHIENLRFRCTTMVARVISWHLPGTIRLLTGGSDEWLRDLAYEYLAYHRWDDLGHHKRFAECRRFAGFARERIAKRRRPPEHLEAVLAFELAVLEVLQDSVQVAEADWPAPSSAPPCAPVGELRPRRGPTTRVVELPVDIVEWIIRPDSPLRVAGPGPAEALIWVPSPTEAHQVERLDSTARAVLDAIDGQRTAGAIAGDQPDGPAALELIQRWRDGGAIIA